MPILNNPVILYLNLGMRGRFMGMIIPQLDWLTEGISLHIPDMYYVVTRTTAELQAKELVMGFPARCVMDDLYIPCRGAGSGKRSAWRWGGRLGFALALD